MGHNDTGDANVQTGKDDATEGWKLHETATEMYIHRINTYKGKHHLMTFQTKITAAWFGNIHVH